MPRSVEAYRSGYRLVGAGTTDFDKLLGNFVVLLDAAAGSLLLSGGTMAGGMRQNQQNIDHRSDLQADFLMVDPAVPAA